MTDKQLVCEHHNFAANVDVARVTDGEGGPVRYFMADVTIHCADCGVPFSFVGLPAGFSPDCAMVNVDATEVSMPIQPGRGGILFPKVEGALA